MKIYIASSWKNQHGVEMLTALLRDKGHEVVSWIENNFGENPDNSLNSGKFDFETWVTSPESDQSFYFDTQGATRSDLVIYYGPSGKDACAELGAAWAAGVPIIGLWAKGEDLGLMRKMAIDWYYHYRQLLEAVQLAESGLISNNLRQVPRSPRLAVEYILSKRMPADRPKTVKIDV